MNNMERVYTILLCLIMMMKSNVTKADDNDPALQHDVNAYQPDSLPERAVKDTPLPYRNRPQIFKEQAYYSREKTGVHGIDVSHYQEHVNWEEVAATKEVGYVYIKATEGRDIVDQTYKYNITEARKYRIKAGTYHFFRPNMDALTQYRNLMSVMNKHEQDLLPLIDVEIVPRGFSTGIFHMRLLELCRLLAQEFGGQNPIIYTGKHFYDTYFADYPQFKNFKFMIAAYNDDPPVLEDHKDYLIWQYSSKGYIDGIDCHVDKSCFVGKHVLSEITVNHSKLK